MGMELIDLTIEIAEEFSAFINEDMAENLGREFFYGIGVLDDDGSTRGAMIYELLNVEDQDNLKSRIYAFGGDGKDIKDMLMKEYESIIKAEGVVESFYESDDESLAKALKDRGFSKETSESLDIIVTIKDIKKVISKLNLNNIPDNILLLSDVFVHQYREFANKCVDNGKYGLLEDLEFLSMDWFEENISSCLVVEDKVNGAFLIKKAPSNTLYALLYVAFGVENQKDLAFLMARTANRIVEDYPKDTKIVIRRHNDSVKKLTDSIFPGMKGEQVYVGQRSEITK